MRKLESSPDDKLYRHKVVEEAGLFEKISETFKSGVEKIKITKENLETRTKNLTSKKKRINLKEIKNKRFRKNARPTFKKDFFESSHKSSLDFLRLRRENPNLFEVRHFNDLAKGDLPSIYLSQNGLENVILDNKELAASGKVNLKVSQPLPSETKPGETILGRGMTTESRGRTSNIESTKLPTFEHYSG